jgi:hypothetical protein
LSGHNLHGAAGVEGRTRLFSRDDTVRMQTPQAEQRRGRPRLRALAVLAVGVVLAGCQSEVASEFSVSSDGVLSGAVRVVLLDEAAKSTVENIEVAKKSVAYQVGVAESAVRVKGDAERLEITVGIPQGVSVPASGVLSTATQVRDEEVWFYAKLGDAGPLRAAILEAVSTEQDADALSEAMRRSVDVCVRVRMSGTVRVVSEGVMVNGSTAELCRGLEEWTGGEMEVRSARADEGGGSATQWYVIGGVAVALAVFLDRRRRRDGGA